jgi:NitT/TauT family transport system ATP-binding protein
VATTATDMAGPGAIRVDGVVKRFDDGSHEVLALSGLSFTVAAGEFVSIVGPSGCGKSTILRILDGLDSASEGRISANGADAPVPGSDRGLVFQSDSLLPWRTIAENVAIGLEIVGVRRSDARLEVARLLRMVGLTGFADLYPAELSGGMRQRANLARALAVDPQILLMDEPFGSLDAQTRLLMQAELLRIWEANRKTVLFITHSIEEAIFLSDRVLVMSARPGHIVDEFDVAIDRPRGEGVIRSREFTSMAEAIWSRLRVEVRLETEVDLTMVTSDPEGMEGRVIADAGMGLSDGRKIGD